MDEIVQFDFPTDSPKIIKVIGVGGGGGNAVNHMYREGIHDVTFVLCNTDNQALAESKDRGQIKRKVSSSVEPATVPNGHATPPKKVLTISKNS